MERKFQSIESNLKNLPSFPQQDPSHCDCIAKMDYLENQSRRNNIIIEGLGPDKEYETWAETENKVCEMFTKNLKLNPKVTEIELAHRNGKFKQNGDKPRPVVVKLLRFKDRELILSKAKAELRKTSIYINEDFSDLLRKKRAELIPAMKEAREKGKYAIISYDRLIIKPKRVNNQRLNQVDPGN